MAKTNVLLLCSSAHSLKNFRGDFIKHLIQNNFNLYCGAPDFEANTLEGIRELGAIPIRFKLERFGLNPFKDYHTIGELKNILRTHKIDLVFPYTIKPVIYGSIAAQKLNIPVVSLITGLGYTFSKISLKARFLQLIAQTLYRKALRKNKAVVFQNSDDLQLFIDNRIVSKKQSLHVVNGSGINLNSFGYQKRTAKVSNAVKFVIVGRLMKEKGVQYFMNAAKKLKLQYPEAEFHIIGGVPNNSSGVSKEELNQLNDSGLIIYHGVTNNVAQIISKMDVFVLPTYYKEGVPRSILEALSTGLAVVTTDTPGCRETVEENLNGFLITPKNESALIDSLTKFLEKPEIIQKMSVQSRRLAEEKFDVNIINGQLLEIINM